MFNTDKNNSVSFEGLNIHYPSCGTVALYGLFINFFFLADHRATDFTLSKICGTPTKNTSDQRENVQFSTDKNKL
jgi:hypothetical protein